MTVETVHKITTALRYTETLLLQKITYGFSFSLRMLEERLRVSVGMTLEFKRFYF